VGQVKDNSMRFYNIANLQFRYITSFVLEEKENRRLFRKMKALEKGKDVETSNWPMPKMNKESIRLEYYWKPQWDGEEDRQDIINSQHEGMVNEFFVLKSGFCIKEEDFDINNYSKEIIIDLFE
jgi:hypothetical protein